MRLRPRLGLGVGLAAVAAMGAFGGTDSGARPTNSAGAHVGGPTAPVHAELRTHQSSAVRTRAVTDMPDDISGSQVHFLYVVPLDGTDRQLDTTGAIEQSITRIKRWVVSRSGDQGLRVDTYNGVPDITFVRLPHTDAQATSVNPWPIDVIGEDLVAAGFNDPDKVYAAFYDGHSTYACGGAKSPALPKLGAMYLLGWPTNDPHPCSDAPGFGTGTDQPGYFEIGLLHEVLHTLGFVPSCAPHVTELDHVDDSPTDLMYHPDAKSPAGWDWSHAVLDFNHDDYYRAHIQGCPDLSDSPYLAPMHLYSLSVTKSGTGGRVTSSPAGTDCGSICTYAFFEGTQVVLTATPDAGWSFRGWSGACTGTGLCTVTMDAAKDIIATFDAPLPPPPPPPPPAPPRPACVVPNVRGKALGRAKKAITRRHCRVGRITKAYSTRVKAGFVISQSRAAGKHLNNGAKIKLTLSRGRRPHHARNTTR